MAESGEHPDKETAKIRAEISRFILGLALRIKSDAPCRAWIVLQRPGGAARSQAVPIPVFNRKLMTHFAEGLGWLLYLALVMTFVVNSVTSLVKLVWVESSEGKVVDSTDALIIIGKTCMCWFQHMRSNRWASVCAVAVFLLMSISSSVSVYASFGYSSIAYAISGFLTPYLIRRMKPLAPVSTVQASPPAQSTDS